MFDSHISNICFKANQKLSVLSSLAGLLTFDRKRVLFKAFFESQFKYCHLIRMFCSRAASNRIDKLYERALKLVYDDYETLFSDLVTIDGSFTIHHINIQTILLEMYKVKYNSSESSLKYLFSVVNDTITFVFNLISEFLIWYPLDIFCQ